MNKKRKVYLDYNATTPVDQRVVDAMMPYYTDDFGNANSDHFFGWDAQEAIDIARLRISNLVHTKPSQIIFTSGATEAANLAIMGFCEQNQSEGKHIISAKTEHRAILDTLSAMALKGFTIHYLKVDADGNINLEELADTLSEETILVCLMLANNETGSIHPIAEISELVHTTDAKLFCDMTQAVGKIPVDLEVLNIDMGIFSSHKMYGPKGVGALYISKRNDLTIAPHMHGGGQENGLRPGTLNVPAIVGFGKAAEIAAQELIEEASRILALRNILEDALDKMGNTKIQSRTTPRLPNTTNVTFKDRDGTKMLRRLNTIAMSRGSACTSITMKPSHVLTEMGLSDSLALSSFRISLGARTRLIDIEFAITEIKRALESLKLETV